jgi:hypothetical protein
LSVALQVVGGYATADVQNSKMAFQAEEEPARPQKTHVFKGGA